MSILYTLALLAAGYALGRIHENRRHVCRYCLGLGVTGGTLRIEGTFADVCPHCQSSSTIGLLATLAFLLLGCAHPASAPKPAPPADPFRGAVITTCDAPELRGQLAHVRGPVGFCLAGDTIDTCLATLAQTYRIDSIACVARDLAAHSWSDDISAAAQQWMDGHGITFR